MKKNKMIGALLFFVLAASAKADLIEECMNYTIYPLQYDLTLMPYILKSGSTYYHCDITIDVIANAPGIQVIELDAQNFNIRKGSIKVLDGNTDIVNGARPYEEDQRKGKLYIYLREPLKRYDVKTNALFVYKIKMSFTKYLYGYSSENNHGLFLANYKDEKGPFKYLITTRFAPNTAKYAFPCFENPRFEAGFRFKVYLMPERSDLQYANTSLTISEVLKKESTNNVTIVNYMSSPQVALHQVGYHLSQFGNNNLKSTYTNDTLYVWGPSKQLYRYNFILYYGVKMIDLIHEFSGTGRPLLNGPINLVAVPLANLDGYEVSSWNLLTNSADKIAKVDLTSIKQLERLKFDLAQQLSRLWLGNPGEPKVTRWREEWFKEGMATYLAYYLLAQYNYGSQTIRLKRPLGYYGIRMKHRAMSHDWHHSTPAFINFNNSLAVEIPSRYKELVTMKTGAIWWMLENWLQTDQLHTSFVKHVNGMRGQYISVWDLMGAIDKDTIECTYQFFNGSTPSRILKSWFYQAGYPVVTVNVLRDRTPNAIQLKQRHFSFNARNREPTEFLIPISYILQTSDNCFNCHQPRFTIAQTYTFSENLNGGWIILNTNASGYYRVNYDRESWKLIAAALKKDPTSINEMNRAQIVNDVFALYMSSDIDRLLAEEILSYLDNERSLTVWEAAVDGFSMLRIEGSKTIMTKTMYWEWESLYNVRDIEELDCLDIHMVMKPLFGIFCILLDYLIDELFSEEFMGKRLIRIFNLLLKYNENDPKIRLLRSHIVSFASEINYEPCLSNLRVFHKKYKLQKQRLDPDIREAAFYVYNNNTRDRDSWMVSNLDSIEEEDKIAAEHKVREKNGFLIRCPHGEPRPMPIIATEAPATSIPITDKLEKPADPSSASTLAVSFVSILISLALIIQ